MPRLATLLHDLFIRAGFNADLFITLPATREAGPQLAEAAVDHVVFTGSADVGRRLARRLGERLISSTLELSGCDAQFLLPDANLELAAQAAWFGVTLNGGQTCLAVRRIFVHESQYEKFLEIMRPLVRNAQPLKLAMNPQATQADRLVREALARGATLLDGGEPYSVGSDHKYRPTIVVNASPDMTICREGSFAPIAAVLRYTDPSELPKMNEACPFGLGASIFTSSQTHADELIARLPVGAVTINDVIAPMGHPATPFGGRHDSGWGSTQGADGLLGMTVPQVISTRSGTFRPHYAGAIPSNVGVVRGLLKLTHARHWWQRLGGIGKIIRALWVKKGDV
jgi:aldehyde dehydrogenase (NAD+)